MRIQKAIRKNITFWKDKNENFVPQLTLTLGYDSYEYNLYIQNNKLYINNDFLSEEKTNNLIKFLATVLSWDIDEINLHYKPNTCDIFLNKTINPKSIEFVFQIRNIKFCIIKNNYKLVGANLFADIINFAYEPFFDCSEYRCDFSSFKDDLIKYNTGFYHHLKLDNCSKYLLAFKNAISIEDFCDSISFAEADLILAFLLQELGWEIPQKYKNKLRKIGR